MLKAATDSKTILAAVSSAAQPFIRTLFSEKYLLTVVDNFPETITLLNQWKYDLIVCNTDFSESRSLELLARTRASIKNSSTTFVMLRINRSRLKSSLTSSIDLAMRASGGDLYLDVVKMQDTMSSNQIVTTLQQSINELLVGPAARDHPSY